jgi:hypothetical protein
MKLQTTSSIERMRKKENGRSITKSITGTFTVFYLSPFFIYLSYTMSLIRLTPFLHKNEGRKNKFLLFSSAKSDYLSLSLLAQQVSFLQLP